MLQDRVRIGRRLNRRRLNPTEVERLLGQARNSARLRQRRRKNRPIPTYPAALPISDRRDEILAAIKAHPVVVVAGETGSGKSTQLPKICLEAGRGEAARIAVTQPRRVAALSIAQRVAEELKVTYGRDIGCKIRFRDQTAPETCIKVMTDGMLLAETQTDPDLLEYDTIIVDEAHERSLNIDFLLGYLRLLRRKRPDLKIIITSATIDTEAFSKAFGDAPVIEVSGRMFPVEVRYWPLDEILQDRGDIGGQHYAPA
ncbi:MAG: DEAD/DEAH box helicase, partial [Gemmatimonadetes bacterium]|nr:DEAD/DEAH box helicase [Gemmatimonadota bacterium]